MVFGAPYTFDPAAVAADARRQVERGLALLREHMLDHLDDAKR